MPPTFNLPAVPDRVRKLLDAFKPSPEMREFREFLEAEQERGRALTAKLDGRFDALREQFAGLDARFRGLREMVRVPMRPPASWRIEMHSPR